MKLHTLFLRASALPIALALLGASSAYAQGSAPSGTEMVTAINGVFGQHPGARAVHAKGTVLQGEFTASKAATSVSKAAHLQGKAIPVTVRFSNFAGIPDIADNHPLASPHGLAIKFTLPDGSHTDLISHSFNGFPSANTSDFLDLLKALGASGPDAAKPTALDTYLGTHPIAKAFLTAPKPAPVSFATLPYYGVNTFKFVNARNATTLGRYQLIPQAGNQNLAESQVESATPNYLQDEIRQRIAQSPVKFDLVLQVAEKGDKVNDPSIAWPDSRQKVVLGTLQLTKVVADDNLLFMPNAITSGIEILDPMVTERSAAYTESYAHRSK